MIISPSQSPARSPAGVAGGGYLSATKAILAEAAALGYTAPSTANIILINTLIYTLKNIGFWDSRDCIGNFMNDSADQNFALINWKNPSGAKFTLVNAPTYVRKDGFDPDGATSYIQTPFTPSTGVNWALDDAGGHWWIYKAPTIGNVVVGNTTNSHARITASVSAAQRINSGNNNMDTSTDFTTPGFLGANRTGSNSLECFKDTTQTSHTGLSSVLNIYPQCLGVTVAVFCNAGHSFCSYGSSFVSQHTALYNAINDYRTAVAALP